jgi:glycolate oxidase iron-sulfur subunit
VVVAQGAGCCGALTHHLGRDAHAWVKANIDAWARVADEGGLDAIVANASGCGTMVKDYGFLLREDAAYADTAARVSALAKDVTEVLSDIGLAPPVIATGVRVVYQSPCSMQHGQRVVAEPKTLLTQAGFVLADIAEEHLCCGSAGTYNILQPELAADLRARKLASIRAAKPALVASGNIGCMTQLGDGAGVPVLHTVELLDWATGGPKPARL